MIDFVGLCVTFAGQCFRSFAHYLLSRERSPIMVQPSYNSIFLKAQVSATLVRQQAFNNSSMRCCGIPLPTRWNQPFLDRVHLWVHKRTWNMCTFQLHSWWRLDRTARDWFGPCVYRLHQLLTPKKSCRRVARTSWMCSYRGFNRIQSERWSRWDCELWFKFSIRGTKPCRCWRRL